jgi:DNA-binding NarL/FixJ family response regulator
MERIEMPARKPRATKPASRRKILIVDDHPMMREGLRGVIDREPDLRVCGGVADARQALAAVQKLLPDLVLLDVNLPGKSGLELVKDLLALQPGLKILAISMHDESLYASRMLRAGARGYITKQEPSEELIRALRLVINDQMYASRDVSQSILRRFSGQPEQNQSPLEILTDREFGVFQLLGQGASNREISRQLHVAVKTVAVHAANIRRKLQLKNTSQLIRYAVQWEK